MGVRDRSPRFGNSGRGGEAADFKVTRSFVCVLCSKSASFVPSVMSGIAARGPESGSRQVYSDILDSGVKNNAKLFGIMPSLCGPRAAVFYCDFTKCMLYHENMSNNLVYLH